MPFLDDPDAIEDTSPDYQRRNAETAEHMLHAACSSFAAWARLNNVPADSGPLAGSILAYRPPVVAGESRQEVEVQRSGCVVLPPRERLSSSHDRSASAAAGRKATAQDFVYLNNAHSSRVHFDGLKPKSAQGRRNAADLESITDQAAALDMCFDRMREVRDFARRPGTNAAGISWMKRWRQFTAEVAHVEWVRWIWIKGTDMTWTERRQEEGLMSLFAAYISKRVDTYSSLLQAVGHVFTWFLMNLQLAAPPMPYLRRFLKWCEKRMGQEVPFRKQRNALEPRHVLGLRQHWLGRAKQFFADQLFKQAAYFVNLLLALLAGVTFGFRTTELCPGKLFFLRTATRHETDAMDTTCSTSLYWERSTFDSFFKLKDGDAQCVAPMWRKTSGAGSRERQERLNQVQPYVRQDTNPINFASNFIRLVKRYDRTPTLPVGVDIAIPAFRNTLTTQGVEAPALDPVTFQRELVAAVAICFPTESELMVFGDAAMRMCATISWFMAGASEADQRAMGTWTSTAFHLYNMAPLERMAFLQQQANAAQFTTAASLRKSTELPVITAAEIVAASVAATAERAATNDFGLGPDIYSESDEDTDDFTSDNSASGSAPAVAPTASLPEAPLPEESSIRRHTSLCSELASGPARPNASGAFLKLDALSDRIAAESARPSARAAPGPGCLPSGRPSNLLLYVPNAQRHAPGSVDKRAASDAAGPDRRTRGRPRMSADAKAASKRKRDEDAADVAAREFNRRRHNFQVKLNLGCRAAAAPPPDSGARTSGVAADATDLQQASSNLLAAPATARVSDLQGVINAGAGVLSEADENYLLDELVPSLRANAAGQSP